MQQKKPGRQGKVLATENLKQIFDNLPEPIFVTDREGNVLLSNSTTALTMDMTLDQLLQSNVRDLVSRGYYTKSYALEAAEKKCVVKGRLVTKLGLIKNSVSTPVFDDNGEVIFVLTTGRTVEPAGAELTPENKELISRRKREIEYLRRRVLETDTIVADSPEMKRVLLQAHSVAGADSTVMIYGESGTGKEVIAKYLHRHSKRAQEPFIAVNCASLPETLAEAELFGYEKGAFTGAKNEGRVGLFEAANAGTIFLDEIAELPLHLQAKLLRVLETGEVRRIGSNLNRKLDFRLIVGTHKDLAKMVEEKSFRADLFYRLNVIPLQIPPLRERPADVAALVRKFLEEFNKQYEAAVEIDPAAMQAMQDYHWPGNVRELRNAVERLVIGRMQDYSQEFLVLESALAGSGNHGQELIAAPLQGTLKEVMSAVENQYIRQVLEECGGKVSVAAQKLGIYRTVLYRKLKAMQKHE